MKLNKKFLASFMAMTMVATPMSIFAADGGTITGTGTVTTLETEIYNLVLPTNKSIDFQVDPYGILDLDPDTNLSDVVSNAAGTVTSSATAIINKSSVPIDVSVEVYFDKTDTTVSNSAVELGTEAEAKAGTKDLYLAVQHLEDSVLQKPVATGTAVDIDVAIDDTTSVSAAAVDLSTAGLQFSTYGTPGAINAVTATDPSVAATPINFSLGDIADAYYVVTGGAANAVTAAAVLSEGAVTYDSNNTYAFAIVGYAYPQASVWKDISDAKANLSLTMKFTISKGSTVPVVENGATIEIPLNGDSVTFAINTTANILSVSNGNYQLTGATINGNKITITNGSDANSSYLFAQAGRAATLTIRLDNGSTYTVKTITQ